MFVFSRKPPVKARSNEDKSHTILVSHFTRCFPYTVSQLDILLNQSHGQNTHSVVFQYEGQNVTHYSDNLQMTTLMLV